MAGEARERRGFDALALHVADDQCHPVVASHGVVEITTDVVAAGRGQVAARELEPRQRKERVGEQAAFEGVEDLRAAGDREGGAERSADACRHLIEHLVLRRAQVAAADADPTDLFAGGVERHAAREWLSGVRVATERRVAEDHTRAADRSADGSLGFVHDAIGVELADQCVRQLVDGRARGRARTLVFQIDGEIFDAMREVGDPRVIQCGETILLPQRASWGVRDFQFALSGRRRKDRETMTSGPVGGDVQGGLTTATSIAADGRVVVRVDGELDLSTVTRFGTALDEAIDGEPAVIELDLGSLTFMDSSGVGAYVTAFRRARAKNVELVIGDRSAVVDRVLQLSGVEEALAAESPDRTAARRVSSARLALSRT